MSAELYDASDENARAVAENAETQIRQAPLPKANDPYEWTGWPLFHAYGLTGDGRPSSKMGRRRGRS